MHVRRLVMSVVLLVFGLVMGGLRGLRRLEVFGSGYAAERLDELAHLRRFLFGRDLAGFEIVDQVHAKSGPVAANGFGSCRLTWRTASLTPRHSNPTSLSADRHRTGNIAGMTCDKDITGLLVMTRTTTSSPKAARCGIGSRVLPRPNCIPHMAEVLDAARSAGIRVFYALHHRYRPGYYEAWKHVAPIQRAAWQRRTFETWGRQLRPEFEPREGDIVAQEHWCSSGFANTDLDLLLKKHGIHRLIVIGLIARTCVEATVRYGAELGYDVTVVRDATASYSDVAMHAALDVNMPNYAAVVTTGEIIAAVA